MEVSNKNYNIKGLSAIEIEASRTKYGYNSINQKKESPIFEALKSLAKEPMVIILLIAAFIYFISGNSADGIFLALSVILVAGISLYQDSKSRTAIKALETFIKPFCKVIRDNKIIEINTEELVIGDFMVVEEGTSVPADGVIERANDFAVNEAILTGESYSISKDQTTKDKSIWTGTNVTSGLAIAKVTAIGNQTRIGKIGQSITDIKEEKTTLELQIGSFVRLMVIIGSIVFMIVWAINFIHTLNILDSLLKALTLAMSILPEEIPVAYTTFMAMGAWRLMKLGIVVKKMKTVEALGNATIICTDKTGTITENKMKLAKLFLPESNQIINIDDGLEVEGKQLITWAMWASEPIPFDPMEIELHQLYAEFSTNDERSGYKMVHEYPLDGKPPMMTHVFADTNGNRIIATKGAPEAIIGVTNLNDDSKNKVKEATQILASEGYRVLGVASGNMDGAIYPKKQQDIKFEFKGLMAFYDPPKKKLAYR
jgi:Ca2+-transporting ATPase